MKKDNLKINSIINVQAYKFNGELYRQWNGVKVLENSSKDVVLHLHKTKVSEKNNQNWTIRETTLWFLPKHKMFNAVIAFKKGLPHIYINLSSSFIFEDNTIKYIDYDLDIKCYPSKDFNIIDKNDFKKNMIKMKYPTALKVKLYANIKYLFDLYINEEYFFNRKYLNTYIEEINKEKTTYKNPAKTK